MKILRRLALVCLVLGLALIAAGIYVRGKAREIPSWYRHIDERTQHLAANSMNQKLLATYGTANDALASAARAQFPDPASGPVKVPTTPINLELSEAEINSFIAEWDSREHWRAKLSKYVLDPLVILEDHELILAGTVPDWNMVVSLHFEPKLENGKLNLGLKRVMVGTLDLPRATVDGYITKIEKMVNQKMPEARLKAEIGPKGWANSAAVEVAMGELLTRSLHDQPAEPVLMLRELIKQQKEARNLPVQITGVEISNKSMTLSMRTMTPDEREALEQHLRGTEVAQGSAGSN